MTLLKRVRLTAVRYRRQAAIAMRLIIDAVMRLYSMPHSLRLAADAQDDDAGVDI